MQGGLILSDHSLRGYLERRTKEELDAILTYCMQEKNYANYEHVILEIVKIMYERQWQPTDSQ